MSPSVFSFVGLPVLFFNIVGVTSFEGVFGGQTVKQAGWKKLLYFTNFMNIFLSFIGEVIYVFLSFKRNELNFFVGIELVLCIGYLCLALVKMATATWYRATFTWIISELDDMFPKTAADHIDYQTELYTKKADRIMRSYSLIQMVMIWLFNMHNLIQSTYDYVVGGEWSVDLPYVIWYPFDVYARGCFEVNYVLQMWAAFSSASGILASDIMLCALAIQVCMQYDHLAKRLRRMRPKGNRHLAQKEFAEIRDCAILHDRLNKCDYAKHFQIRFVYSNIVSG